MKFKTKKSKVLVVFVALAVVSAGCIGPASDLTGEILGDSNENDGSSQGDNLSDALPSDSNVIIRADPTGLAEDETTRKVGNHVINEYANGEQNYTEYLNQGYSEFDDQLATILQNESLDIQLTSDDIGEFVMFASVDENQISSAATNVSAENTTDYVGMAFELGLTEDEIDQVFNLAKDEYTGTADVDEVFSKSTYNGKTIYTVKNVEDDDSEFNNASLAILDSENNYHVIGPKNVVEDSIDTYQGDHPRVSDNILPNRDSNTYLSVGASGLNESLDGLEDEVDSMEEPPTAESVVFSYSTNNDDTVYIDMKVGFEEAISASRSAYEFENLEEDINDQIRESDDINESVIGEVNIDSTSSDLVVSYETTVTEINNGIDFIYETYSGTRFGPSDPASEPEFETGTEASVNIDQSPEQVQITLDNPDNLDGAYVSYRNTDDEYATAGAFSGEDLQSAGDMITISEDSQDGMVQEGSEMTVFGILPDGSLVTVKSEVYEP